MLLTIRVLVVPALILMAAIFCGCRKQTAEAEPVAIEPVSGFDDTVPPQLLPKPGDPTFVLGRISFRDGEQVSKGHQRTLKPGQGCFVDVTAVPDVPDVIPGGGVRIQLLDETGRFISYGSTSKIVEKNKSIALLKDTALQPYLAPPDKPGKYRFQLVCTYFTANMQPHQVQFYEAPLIVE